MDDDWIPFDDGRYAAAAAFLVSSANRAVPLADVVVEVETGAAGRRSLRGRGRVENLLLVALMEDAGEPDLVLDFGGEHKYRLPAPRIQGGKVFAAEVKSMLQFHPSAPWRPLTPEDWRDLTAQLSFVTP